MKNRRMQVVVVLLLAACTLTSRSASAQSIEPDNLVELGATLPSGIKVSGRASFLLPRRFAVFVEGAATRSLWKIGPAPVRLPLGNDWTTPSLLTSRVGIGISVRRAWFSLALVGSIAHDRERRDILDGRLRVTGDWDKFAISLEGGIAEGNIATWRLVARGQLLDWLAVGGVSDQNGTGVMAGFRTPSFAWGTRFSAIFEWRPFNVVCAASSCPDGLGWFQPAQLGTAIRFEWDGGETPASPRDGAPSS